MDAALAQAKEAFLADEVPVGAVVAYQGDIIAAARNSMEAMKDATAHAEMLALRRAAEKLGDWRLKDCILAVTLEPCTMCTGALRLSRLPVVVFGLRDPRAGALGSLYDLSQDERWGGPMRVISGVHQDKAKELLQNFFAQKRRKVLASEGLH
ncbi:MAG: nucleoside deaminase [Oligoflexia bacterium]|nr:nucleoside deaminase [Oligoflexia bacterium]